MRFDDRFLEEIKSRVRLSDVIGLAHRPPVAYVPEDPDPVGDDLAPAEEIA